MQSALQDQDGGPFVAIEWRQIGRYPLSTNTALLTADDATAFLEEHNIKPPEKLTYQGYNPLQWYKVYRTNKAEAEQYQNALASEIGKDKTAFDAVVAFAKRRGQAFRDIQVG
jgi:hypothetical protein